MKKKRVNCVPRVLLIENSNNTISEKEHEIICGHLLGDGSIEKSKASKNARLKIERKTNDKNYLEWSFQNLNRFCSDLGISDSKRFDTRYNKYNFTSYFRTRASPCLNFYYDAWKCNLGRTPPTDLQLTPLIVAIWLADDGCIRRSGAQSLMIKFSTESFGKIKTQQLCDKLNVIYPGFYLHKKNKNCSKDQWVIKGQSKASWNLLRDVAPFLKEIGMLRKYDLISDLDLSKPYARNNYKKKFLRRGPGASSWTQDKIICKRIYDHSYEDIKYKFNCQFSLNELKIILGDQNLSLNYKNNNPYKENIWIYDHIILHFQIDSITKLPISKILFRGDNTKQGREKDYSSLLKELHLS